MGPVKAGDRRGQYSSAVGGAWIRCPLLHKVDQMIEFTRGQADAGKIREVLGLGTYFNFVTYYSCDHPFATRPQHQATSPCSKLNRTKSNDIFRSYRLSNR